jgi:hypothetical protein
VNPGTNDNFADKRLWERCRNASGGATKPKACPDGLTVAAYLDGRLTPVEVEQVEDHLSRCRNCQDVVLAARLLLADGPMFVAQEATGRAKGLVTVKRSGMAGRLIYVRTHAWRAAMAASVLVAVSLFASWAGYGAGHSMGGPSLAKAPGAAPPNKSDATLAQNDLTGGIFDSSSDDSDSLSALLAEGGSGSSGGGQ